MTDEKWTIDLTIDGMGQVSIRCRRGKYIRAMATAPIVAWSGEHPERLIARALADDLRRFVAGALGARGLGGRAEGDDLFSPEPDPAGVEGL